MKKAIAILVFCLFLYGCNAAQERGEENRTSEETDMNNSTSQGAGNGYSNAAEEIEEALMTKEEFLRRVSENEDFFGVTIADFDEIDVEDFIEARTIVASTFDARFLQTDRQRHFRLVLDGYIRDLPMRRLSLLLPQELVIADSTDEEYEEFKARFFEGIGHEISPWSRWDRMAIADGITEGYEFTGADGEFDGFVIGRTMFIEQLKEMRWRFNENPVWAYIPDNDMEIGSHMFLSSCGRFFLIYVSSPDLVELFIGLDISGADR